MHAPMLDRMAQRYGQRPSTFIKGEWWEYCFDEAVAMRAIMEENKAIKEAREAAEKTNEMETGDAGLSTNIKGKVGQIIDQEAYKKYIELGGTWNPRKDDADKKDKLTGRKKWLHK